MRIRPYIESKDFDEMINWITEERTHVFDSFDDKVLIFKLLDGMYAELPERKPTKAR